VSRQRDKRQSKKGTGGVGRSAKQRKTKADRIKAAQHLGYWPTVEAKERRGVAKALVSILVTQPQASAEAPRAHPTGPTAEGIAETERETGAKPIAFQEVDQLFTSTGLKDPAPDQVSRRSPPARSARVNNRQISRAPRVPVADSGPVETKPRKRGRRPGTGGRQPRDQSASSEATRRLHAILGEPDQILRGSQGARTEIWQDPDPGLIETLLKSQGPGHMPSQGLPLDGPHETSEASKEKPKLVALARLSSQELQGGETIGGQLIDGIRCALANDARIVAVVASTAHRMELPRSERQDIDFALELIRDGQADGIVFRDPERVARKQFVAHNVYEDLRQVGGDLYLAEQGRRIDWNADGDVLQLSMMNAFGEVEARRDGRKMHTAIRRRWLEQGRGWPGAKKLGFRRNPVSKFLEVDPEQWWIVCEIHENYRDACRGRANGCRVLAERLAEKGVELSAEKVRQILTDPIYVDGQYTVRYRGEYVACEPIPLDNPIPRALFQQNQEALATRKGPNTVTPTGTYCLNGIKIFDAEALGWRNPNTGALGLYKGRSKAGRRAYYFCRGGPEGFKPGPIPQEVLEPPIIEQLLRLAEDDELRQAWAEAARVEVEAGGNIKVVVERGKAFWEAQSRELEETLANLKSSQEEQLAELLERSESGHSVSRAHRTLIERLDERIAQVESKLKSARSQAKRQEEPEPVPGSSDEDLAQALREVLTIEVPEDPKMRIRRQAVIECCLSQVVLKRKQDEIEIMLFGPLAPIEAIESGEELPINPLEAARHLLEAHLEERDGEEDAGEGSEGSKGNTSTLGSPCVEVFPYQEAYEIESRRLGEAGRAERRRRWRQNRWHNRFRGYRGPWSGIWRGSIESDFSAGWTDQACEAALREAAAAVEEGQPLTWNCYRRLTITDPSLPDPAILRRRAHKQGLTFAEWRNRVVPKHGYPVRMRDGYWNEERILDAFRRADAETGLGNGLGRRVWDQLCRGRTDLPSRKRIDAVSRASGTSFAALRARALAERGDSR
jgi:hypothetical protein